MCAYVFSTSRITFSTVFHALKRVADDWFRRSSAASGRRHCLRRNLVAFPAVPSLVRRRTALSSAALDWRQASPLGINRQPVQRLCHTPAKPCAGTLQRLELDPNPLISRLHYRVVIQDYSTSYHYAKAGGSLIGCASASTVAVFGCATALSISLCEAISYSLELFGNGSYSLSFSA
ncbi:unnamed protein product [Heligmosomoides polygyrus]|uniref:FHA domain-containing protein n=1 Tax=Heligmosomoides polygyrus TaxID=6339 RepID=A0A183GHY9_HELPZ|nr:unnamed protein product [Heligmosomoides polygyrus]